MDRITGKPAGPADQTGPAAPDTRQQDDFAPPPSRPKFGKSPDSSGSVPRPRSRTVTQEMLERRSPLAALSRLTGSQESLDSLASLEGRFSQDSQDSQDSRYSEASLDSIIDLYAGLEPVGRSLPRSPAHTDLAAAAQGAPQAGPPPAALQRPSGYTVVTMFAMHPMLKSADFSKDDAKFFYGQSRNTPELRQAFRQDVNARRASAAKSFGLARLLRKGRNSEARRAGVTVAEFGAIRSALSVAQRAGPGQLRHVEKMLLQELEMAGKTPFNLHSTLPDGKS